MSQQVSTGTRSSPLPPILGNGYDFTTSSSRKPGLIIIITGIERVFDLRTERLSVFGEFLSHESGVGGEPDFHQEAEKARSQLSQGPLQPGSGHVTEASQFDIPAQSLTQPRRSVVSDPIAASILG